MQAPAAVRLLRDGRSAEPFVDLSLQRVHLRSAFSEGFEPVEKLALTVLFQRFQVHLQATNVFWRATSGARDTARQTSGTLAERSPLDAHVMQQVLTPNYVLVYRIKKTANVIEIVRIIGARQHNPKEKRK